MSPVATLRVLNDYVVMSSAEDSYSNGSWTCHGDLAEAYRCARAVGGLIYRRAITRDNEVATVTMKSVPAATLRAFQEAFADLPETGLPDAS